MFLFLLLLHWYLPDNYDCIKPLYWFILDRHICITAWGALAGFLPRPLPPFWTFALNYRPVDVIIYALAEITALCLIVSCLSSPRCQLKGPGVPKPFTLVVWLIALHKSFPSYFVKIGLFYIFLSKIIIKRVICTCCLAMRESILEVTAVPKSRLFIFLFCESHFSSLN